MFSALEGLTIVEVRGLYYESGQVVFETACGSEMMLEHVHQCCETVEVEDVSGDVLDILNTPVLSAEERVSTDEDFPHSEYGSDTWTFYTIRTIKGTLDIRWHGSSNGYYSESVNCTFRKSSPQIGA